ncbi:MAG: hypothetical protein Unbinned2851contig1000_43 [Prokaryotic dsDNA virus sp.]|nr:MAG: hypothetical protein Unbinned2851contig1000_43 [Prokaryotic dsDNA virus sp.]|tara:strand:+ start:27505 stop:28239 length:735 start_codon:yes stop_codon:yes gene_type:complete
MQKKIGFKIKPDAPDIHAVVATNIRKIMNRNHIKTHELAHEMGASLATVQRIVSGSANPTVNTLSKLAFALHTTPEKLLVDRVDNDLTGIPAIDEAIYDMFLAIWSDIETARTLIGHRIHPDYRIYYCDAPTREEALGPNFEDEVKINGKHPHRVDYNVYSASIIADTSILIHNCTLSAGPREEIIPRGKPKRTATQGLNPIIKAEVIDIWDLTHTVDEIRKNKDLKWQITARKLKVLRESAEV